MRGGLAGSILELRPRNGVAGDANSCAGGSAMDSKTFDAFAIRLGAKASRRRVVTRLAQAGGAAALAGAFSRPFAVGATSAACPNGMHTCATGYVWRLAYNGDTTCVDPSQRDQA